MNFSIDLILFSSITICNADILFCEKACNLQLLVGFEIYNNDNKKNTSVLFVKTI